MKKYGIYGAFVLIISTPIVMQSSQNNPNPDAYPDPSYKVYTYGQLAEQEKAYRILIAAEKTKANIAFKDWEPIKRWPREKGDDAEFYQKMDELNKLWNRIVKPQAEDEGNPKAMAKRLWDELPGQCQQALQICSKQ
jgi:hypothetical protein